MQYFEKTKLFKLLGIAILFCLSFHSGFSQSEEDQILAARNASNRAIKSFDLDGDLAALTEDVLITTGAGTLLCGKDALKAYIQDAKNAKPMFWVRHTSEIEVNSKSLLAWEQGIWKGYAADDEDEKNVLVHGKYSAMWTKTSGEWKIKSQLFVSLP